MGHPNIDNQTPFHFEPLFIQDEQMRPLLVPVLKCTFRIQPDHLGPVIPMRDQPGLLVGGSYYGDPETSCYEYEPECSPLKSKTDVVLIADGKAPEAGLTYFDTGLRVGTLVKVARVFGERHWYKSIGTWKISPPLEVNTQPLTYEYAFGGTDTTHETAFGPAFDPRNPVGKGYHHNKGDYTEGSPLPNIEDPYQLIENYHDAPAPQGFGFVHPNWQPRLAYAGTYDEAWENNRKPLLPTDFNPFFYNAASPGLVADGYLKGDEPVMVLNASPWPKLNFRLPALTPPTFWIDRKSNTSLEHSGQLDTVIVNTRDMLLHLYYRARIPLNRGVHDVAAITVSINGEAANQGLEIV